MLHNNALDFEQVLSELARGNVVANSSLRDVLQFLIKKSANVLNVRRASIWRFDPQHDNLECVELFDTNSAHYQSGEILTKRQYPLYFTAIEQMRTIAAVEAEIDPRTLELRENYLRKYNITTMLDAPVFLEGEVIGVVCHEHSDSPRIWSEKEKSFAGSVADFISLAFEASRRLEAEQRLRETEQLLQTVTAQMTDGLCLLEPDFATHELIMRYVNPNGAAIFGYAPEELIDKPTSMFRVEGWQIDVFALLEYAKSGESITFETPVRRKDNSIFTVEINLNLIQHNGKTMVAFIGRDITERLAAEQRRMNEQAKNLQTQRLESLGMLSGKIAHDFNNLLVGILGNVSLVKRHLPENEKIFSYLGNVESTAQIAAELCNQMLIYSGKQQFEMSAVNLSELVEEMSRLLEVSLPPNVSLRSEIDENLPLISAEQTQIRQILLNLIINAADAMAGKDGYIGVKTCICKMTAEELANQNFDIQAANFDVSTAGKQMVCLEVSDNGAGMSAETRERIFEPFFTTKAKGRGLGMAALGGIVRAHGGAIKVESALDEGTTVCVWFPAQNEIIP